MMLDAHRFACFGWLVSALVLGACGENDAPPDAVQPPVELTVPPGRLPTEDCEQQSALIGEGACRARWWCADGSLRELVCVVQARETRCVCLLGEESLDEADDPSGGAGPGEADGPTAGSPVDGDRCQDARGLRVLAETACGWDVP